MQSLVECICLRIVRHSDSVSIATILTHQLGRITCTIPAGASLEARRRRALMMPFSRFEAVVHSRSASSSSKSNFNKSEMMRLSDVTAMPGAAAATYHPVKSVVAAFLADFLYTALRDSQADALLSDFVFDSVALFEGLQGNALANFHLYFIYRLSRFLGIAPDMGTYHDGWSFDMREGVFCASRPMHSDYVDGCDSRIMAVLSRLSPRSLSLLKLNRDQRNEILDRMLKYYSMHHMPLSGLTSLQIVREVMS